MFTSNHSCVCLQLHHMHATLGMRSSRPWRTRSTQQGFRSSSAMSRTSRFRLSGQSLLATHGGPGETSTHTFLPCLPTSPSPIRGQRCVHGGGGGGGGGWKWLVVAGRWWWWWWLVVGGSGGGGGGGVVVAVCTSLSTGVCVCVCVLRRAHRFQSTLWCGHCSALWCAHSSLSICTTNKRDVCQLASCVSFSCLHACYFLFVHTRQ
jgi:hypothetical protein